MENWNRLKQEKIDNRIKLLAIDPTKAQQRASEVMRPELWTVDDTNELNWSNNLAGGYVKQTPNDIKDIFYALQDRDLALVLPHHSKFKYGIQKKERTMLEILEIKKHLLAGEIESALLIVEELEEMGRQSEIRNLESFLVILLIHLIKIQVEKRLTNSWKSSIINSLLSIQKRNKLGKKAHYIYDQNWQEYLEDNFIPALVSASREVFGGIDYTELKTMCDRVSLLDFANSLLQLTYSNNQEELVTEIENKLKEFCP